MKSETRRTTTITFTARDFYAHIVDMIPEGAHVKVRTLSGVARIHPDMVSDDLRRAGADTVVEIEIVTREDE